MAETLTIISMVSLILSGICFAVAVLSWFIFKIPYVIGDLSGRNAKKSIERMRISNKRTGDKTYHFNVAEAGNAAVGRQAEVFAGDATLPLAASNVTEELGSRNDHTAILFDGTGKGNVLGGGNNVMKLTMIEDVVFIHTNEVI